MGGSRAGSEIASRVQANFQATTLGGALAVAKTGDGYAGSIVMGVQSA